MRDFHAIIKELKRYLAKDKNKKIYDKDLAKALNITQVNFATIKRRNSIPYENIIIFCKKENLCCSEVFFD
jgi:hypothetical protein